MAAAQKVPLIDLDKRSQALLQNMGVENSKLLFLHLMPGENPNYPAGKEDNTHFNELGARKMAQLVLVDLKALKLGLAERIVAPCPPGKHLFLHSRVYTLTTGRRFVQF
ncbi:hypothetical protein CLV60_101495 [Dyadobacter jiangsuensis]|uniref:Uncharacterized protein n=1 Tax=Dyadobacter jiangsuensis TaxID=1591085 RepID=A0A2P8GJI1_9BACT|nr:hypothetical protein CLV60_101495 [Dyadobacter jiangsuensis]